MTGKDDIIILGKSKRFESPRLLVKVIVVTGGA